MLKHALHTAALGTASLFVLLALWRIAYSLSDWAALALVPMAVLLFMSQRRMSATLYRARLRNIFRSDSTLTGRFTGQCKAVLVALLFVVTAVPLLAWQTLRAGWNEALGLAVLSLLAGVLLAWMQAWVRQHVHRPFVDPLAALLATWAVALPAIVLLSVLYYNFVTFPGEIRAAGNPWAAALIGIEQGLPARNGWVREILAPLAAWDAFKLWFVTRDSMPAFVRVLFVADAALVSFIVARAGVLANLFFQHYLPAPAANNGKETGHD